MRVWLVAGFAVAALGCGKKDRPHPRVAEVTTPVHVTVRSVDYPDRAGCESVSGPLDRVKCWVAPNRKGFTYVEAGTDADNPVSTKGDLALDTLLIDGRDNTQQLIAKPLKKVRIEFDPSSATRAVVDADAVGFVLSFSGSQLIEQDLLWEEPSVAPRLPDGSLDWARIRPAGDPRLDLSGLSRQALEAMAKSELGREHIDDAVLRWAEEEMPLEAPEFVAALELCSEDARESVILTLLSNLRSGSVEPIGWFERHPTFKGPGFEEALRESLSTLNGEDLAAALRALGHSPSPALLAEACATIEGEYFLTDDEWSYRDHVSSLGALALIAHAKAKCAWVVPLLTRSLCEAPLSCRYLSEPLVDEELEDLGLEPAARTEPVPAPRPTKRWCSAADKQAVLDRYFSAPPDEEEDLRDFREADWGPLLLLAAEAQGPLPPDLAKRLARRGYTRVRPKTKTPDEMFGCEVLAEEDDDPDRWACRVPANLSTSTRDECRLEIDDARRVLKLTPLGAPLVEDDR